MGSIEIKDLIVWVVIGLVAGWLAHLVLPTSGGFGAYLVSGILGSIVGPIILRVAGIDLRLGSVVVNQVVASVIGAIIVVIIGMIVT
jgi:uncharacterized membrane protein YeaQ/YmgE (transglycosylase-associated protein family)